MLLQLKSTHMQVRSWVPVMTAKLLFLIFFMGANGDSLHVDDEDKLKAFSVIPEIIQSTPPDRVDVTYKNGLVVDMGNALKTMQVHEPPAHMTYPADKDALYTLIVTDPDVPPSIGGTSLQHLLIVNIPGNEIEKGETIWKYLGASPPKGTSFHRYIFLVYKQTNRLDASEYTHLIDEKGGRVPTRIQNTVESICNSLHLQGPAAINFFRVEWDENSDRYLEEAHSNFS